MIFRYVYLMNLKTLNIQIQNILYQVHHLNNLLMMCKYCVSFITYTNYIIMYIYY